MESFLFMSFYKMMWYRNAINKYLSDSQQFPLYKKATNSKSLTGVEPKRAKLPVKKHGRDRGGEYKGDAKVFSIRRG